MRKGSGWEYERGVEFCGVATCLRQWDRGRGLSGGGRLSPGVRVLFSSGRRRARWHDVHSSLHTAGERVRSGSTPGELRGREGALLYDSTDRGGRGYARSRLRNGMADWHILHLPSSSRLLRITVLRIACRPGLAIRTAQVVLMAGTAASLGGSWRGAQSAVVSSLARRVASRDRLHGCFSVWSQPWEDRGGFRRCS